VAIDHFSKAATAMEVVVMKANTAIHFIKIAAAMSGNYEQILIDRVPYFTLNIFKRWCEKKV
jgi:hypothetical protein